MHICLQDFTTNQDILNTAESTGAEAMILRSQLQWSGHVTRMENNHIPKQLLFDGLA